MTKRIIKSFSIIMTFMIVLMLGTVITFAATVNSGTGLVNSSSGAFLRSKASTSSDLKLKNPLKDNTKLTIKSVVFTKKSSTKAKYKWYKVSVNGTSGYIRSDLVDTIKYKDVQGKTTKKIKYYSGAGTAMTSKGTLAKGKKITIYLKAKPLSSYEGTSATWYMINVNSKKYYVSSAEIALIDEESKENPSDDKKDDEKKEDKFSKMTDAEFDAYLDKQGFSEKYKTKLVDLHKKHPNWVFKGYKTGLKWSDVLDNETKDGVSLVNGSYPISYRDTGSKSFTPGNVNVYKAANTKTIIETTKGLEDFTLLDEVWNGTKQWNHVKLADGNMGYIKGALFEQSYSHKYVAVIKAGETVNVRNGAGTDNGIVGTKKAKSDITVVLRAKDKKTGGYWYKIKISGGYGYVSGDYVKFTGEEVPEQTDGTANVLVGSWKAKDGSTWFNAKRKVVAYYLDPRNFLTEDRIAMFENLKYDNDTDFSKAVGTVLSPTKLPEYGFNAELFIAAGKANDVSPVFLASRARQETGGGSDCINGTKYNGKVVYNPFNIGASSGANPVMKALAFAEMQDWTTQEKAINGSAKYLANNYIAKNQHSNYFQKFNVANGAGSVATHQYMTNIMAPYSESYSTMESFKTYGLDKETLTFIIPIYTSMPSSTSLPK